MRSMVKLLPLGVVAILLTACGGPSRPTGAVTAPVVSPAAGAGATSPGRAATVPGACTLITQADLVAATKDTVSLEFAGDPSEESRDDLVGGATSVCRQALKSTWSDPGGSATVDGVVIVTIQAGGASVYFPIRTGEPVSGVGDEAMSRDRTLYVRVGGGLLILQIGIANPADDQATQQLAWAKTLAATALGRV